MYIDNYQSCIIRLIDFDCIRLSKKAFDSFLIRVNWSITAVWMRRNWSVVLGNHWFICTFINITYLIIFIMWFITTVSIYYAWIQSFYFLAAWLPDDNLWSLCLLSLILLISNVCWNMPFPIIQQNSLTFQAQYTFYITFLTHDDNWRIFIDISSLIYIYQVCWICLSVVEYAYL